jgi:hypothetical protein
MYFLLLIIERLVVDQPRKQDSPDQIVCSYDRQDGSPRVIRFLNGPASPGADKAAKGAWIGDGSGQHCCASVVHGRYLIRILEKAGKRTQRGKI